LSECGNPVERRQIAPVEVLQLEDQWLLGGDRLERIDQLSQHARARRAKHGAAEAGQSR
jgi:hypothetical protein